MLVWTEAMTTVTARFGVSANYLSRVCDHLNVPHPNRGYWAKLTVGKAAKRPPLPLARPGEELQWTKGTGVPRASRLSAATIENRTNRREGTSTSDRTMRHQLVANVREFFEAGRLSEVGYLRPFKRNLVDVFVSRETLPYALDTANELFMAFEDRGHRVTLASNGEFHRPQLIVQGGPKPEYYNESWSPGRQTVVFIGNLAFGVTIFETTEEVEVKHDWESPIRYIRVTAVKPKRAQRWAGIDTSYKKHMPSGRLAVRAYCPYSRVNWEKRWCERENGELSQQFKTIVKALEAAVPTIVSLRQEAQKQAELEHQRWEAQWREYEKQQEERRRTQTLKESREQLIAILQAWSFARSFDSFFEDIQQQVSALPAKQREAILGRIGQARAMLGGTDTLTDFQKWKSPSER
jgi:hypothetical protein